MNLQSGVIASKESLRIKVSDDVLLRRIGQRDRDALELLYERYSALVLGIALQTRPNRADAEEVVIETFWYVWKHADRIRGGAENLDMWFRTIVGWVATGRTV